MAWFPSSNRREVAELTAKVATLEQAVSGLTQRIAALAQPDLVRDLLARAEHAERAQRELADQSQHLLQLLADARRELRGLKGG